MLKTIGTTSKQIRKIVRTQALRISVYGIPIGILLGVAVSFAGMPFVVKTFSSAVYTAMPSTISFNPLIFIGTIIFAVFTILISCRKPAKFAGNITPVEALNYTGIKGVMVDIEDTLIDVEDILNGKYDDVDESKLLFRGTLHE